MLDALDKREDSDNTIIVLWGDHGWQLGEHGFWCKHVTFRTSLQIPMIVRAPGFAGRAGSNIGLAVWPAKVSGTARATALASRLL